MKPGTPVLVLLRRPGKPKPTDSPQRIEAIIVKRNGNNIVVQAGDRRWRTHPQNILPRD